jgi:tetratricopeptide (TPR) repeat protein
LQNATSGACLTFAGAASREAAVNHIRREVDAGRAGPGAPAHLAREFRCAAGAFDHYFTGAHVEGRLASEGEEAGGAATAAAAPVVPDGLDPVAAAAALNAAKTDPRLAYEAAAYFRKQSVLLDMQAEDMREQRRMQLKHLQLELSREKIDRFAGLLKVATHLFFIIAATVLAVVAVGFLRAAVTSRTVVVEAFDAPSSLEATGLTGKVVAGRLLDELAKIQSLTRAAAEKRDLSSAWTNDIQVEVPETGTSIGDIMRAVRRLFGDDTHIDGDLVQDAAGFTLSVRGDGVAPQSFSGPDLAPLIVEAAKHVYSESQPYLYLDYLNSLNRGEDAVAFAQAIYATADPDDKPYILSQWAYASMSTGRPTEDVLRLYQEALRLKPDYWVAYNNVQNSYQLLGQEEEALRAGREMMRAAGGRPGKAQDLYYQPYDFLTWDMNARLKALEEDSRANSGLNTSFQVIGPVYADIHWRLHDLAAARLHLDSTQAIETEPSTQAMVHWLRAMLLMEEGQAAAAAEEMGVFVAAYADPAVVMNNVGYQCWAGPVFEAAGRRAEADAVLASGPRHHDCLRFRGDVLDARGDWTGAQAAYAAAIDLAPSLPAAYYSLGLALMRRGDVDGAITQFSAAHERGPRWADPLKAWGDALMRKGETRAARRRYDQALPLAPNWSALQDARAAARP